MKLMHKNRIDLVATLQKAATALERHCAGQTVSLDGKPAKARAVIEKLRRHAGAWQAAAAMYEQWVATTRRLSAELRADIVPTMHNVRVYAGFTFGEKSRIYGEFGFRPRKKWKTTVKAQRAANEKRAATRKARGTMGKRQRRAIRGVVAAPTAAG